jgi:putative ATPase
MARMLDGGEDPKFIARRMIVLASEDIGNADPNALTLATSCFTAVDYIGMPEARIVLSQAATYLASCPKSNTSTLSMMQWRRATSRRTGAASSPQRATERWNLGTVETMQP